MNESSSSKQIEAILFDMGGTLRVNIPRNQAARIAIIGQIPELLGSNEPASEFSQLLADRENSYEDWATKNLTELNEERFWTEWMLPDWPNETVSRHAMDLNAIWRNAICERIFFRHTAPTICALHQLGYRLGLVSNTTSSLDAPHALAQAGIADCFEVIVLSCVIGKRKPHPGILLEAASRMNIQPSKCAYIGDRPEWDVVAAREAGFGRTVILRNQRYTSPPPASPDLVPDDYIDNLDGLLGIFPTMN